MASKVTDYIPLPLTHLTTESFSVVRLMPCVFNKSFRESKVSSLQQVNCSLWVTEVLVGVVAYSCVFDGAFFIVEYLS